MHLGGSYLSSEFPSIQCAVSYKHPALSGLRVAKGGFHRRVGAESGSFCRLSILSVTSLSRNVPAGSPSLRQPIDRKQLRVEELFLGMSYATESCPIYDSPTHRSGRTPPVQHIGNHGPFYAVVPGFHSLLSPPHGGWHLWSDLGPGADAPGFMLTPPPEALGMAAQRVKGAESSRPCYPLPFRNNPASCRANSTVILSSSQARWNRIRTAVDSR